MYGTFLPRILGAARSLCYTLAVAVTGCDPSSPDEPARDATAVAPFTPAPVVVDAAVTPFVSPTDAMAQPATDASLPSATRDTVDASGLRGALADTPFLTDMGDGKKSLILVDWELPAGSEIYLCGRVTVPETVLFNGSYPVNPTGTHHTAVTVLPKPDAPDGVRRCDVAEVGRQNIGGSGVGTVGRRFPEGVAIKVEGGSQIVLNLHLFNFSQNPLRGRSGSLIETVAPSQVTTLADGVAAGPLKLDIPIGTSVQTSVCTVDYDYSIFSVFPHMHEAGRHMKVVVKRAAGDEVVLRDGAYDFSHQWVYPIDPPLPVAVGDKIEVSCTYQNATSQPLHFGESSKDEMCIAGMNRFPGGGKSSCPY